MCHLSSWTHRGQTLPTQKVAVSPYASPSTSFLCTSFKITQRKRAIKKIHINKNCICGNLSCKTTKSVDLFDDYVLYYLSVLLL
ncbi:hypothetical protein EUTSA_v10028009mg [Eutrema salsugineum]|uniref:Uncharacterized protein n=1 Tax=Eutrema salsugineum TaxID=72664 RepID=V4LY19_EUTSA|nr:hypothetical protein EUTSA_v10028009mg [Eutrema salsugineum]